MAKAKRKTRAKRARKPRPRAIEIALAGLAHDIRTPLTGILALSQLLQASELPKRERGWAEAIRGRRRPSGAAHHPRGRCGQGGLHGACSAR
jgi:signal transduction histidine kinase